MTLRFFPVCVNEFYSFSDFEIFLLSVHDAFDGAHFPACENVSSISRFLGRILDPFFTNTSPYYVNYTQNSQH